MKVEFIRVDGQAVPIFFVPRQEVSDVEILEAYRKFAQQELQSVNKPF